jgi:hypothetical protein
MRKIFAVLLVSLVSLLPLTAQAAAGPPGGAKEDSYPYILGVGAIGGALLFNFLTGGVTAMPLATSVEGGSLWEGAMAVNRVLAVASAVVGIWLVDWAYKNLIVKKE